MDWMKRMNDVVEYIEANLDSDIDFGVFGKIFCCSTYYSVLVSILTSTELLYKYTVNFRS